MPTKWPASTKILLVDDIPAARVLLRRMLISLGLQNVIEAADGSSAFIALEREGADLVLSDWNMIPMTGYQLLQTMRADDRFAHVPFVMITGNQAVEEITQAKKAGVDGYLVKPFALQHLTKQLSVIGSRRR
jgi:two-component system, chemotaxis family, chemotaxis protein CheY